MNYSTSPIEQMSPSDDEILVAQILLDLPRVIRETESSLGFNWAVKKRRSRPDAAAPSPEDPAAATSPVTPLSFPHSESDSKKICVQRTQSRDECVDSIDELTRLRNCLRGEIEKVTKHYDELNAYNSELKAMKREVLKRKRETEMGVAQNRHHQIRWAPPRPLAVDPLAVRFQGSLGPITAQFYSPYNGPGPMGRIPDLNISDSRARFAEARRMRKGIIKIKSMRRACGIKLPETT